MEPKDVVTSTKFKTDEQSFQGGQNICDYLDLLQGIKDGKIIQWRTFGGQWRDQSSVMFSDSRERYRIKPEQETRTTTARLRLVPSDTLPLGWQVLNDGDKRFAKTYDVTVTVVEVVD